VNPFWSRKITATTPISSSACSRARILNPRHVLQTVADTRSYPEGANAFADRKRYPFPLLLLLDLKLSDGSGFDLLRWLKENPRHAPPAVVVLTGGDITAIRRVYDAGANSFLVKPLHFQDFENMVTAVRGIQLTRVADGCLLERSASQPFGP
jgi:DNA-binding response OmpR family regulator